MIRAPVPLMRVALAAVLLGISAVAFAVIETYTFSDPGLEARYHALSQELRCPKCQNQNIADSNAPIAKDLRFLLHSKLEQGATDDEILSFMVARYGEFVRYRPAVDSNTWVLWFGPGALALLGLVLLARQLGRKDMPSASVSEQDLQQLRDQVAERQASEGRS